MRNYENLVIWQKALRLAEECYEVTEAFPRAERFGITSQMRRAAVSIPSNIAEGCGRDSRNDFARFLRIAYGSGCELGTQIEIARYLEYGDTKELNHLKGSADDVRRMIYTFTDRLPPS